MRLWRNKLLIQTKKIFIIIFLFYCNSIQANEISLATKIIVGDNKKTLSQKRNYSGFKLDYKYSNINSALQIQKSKTYDLIYDGSYINYKSSMYNFGLGAISRNWSFSPNNSLILSKNSRPTKSIYFKLDSGNYTDNIKGWIPPWTLEMFNGWNNSKKGPDNSMLLGIRTTFKPTKRLNLEFIRTTQWGGSGKQSGLNGLYNALMGNTNEGKHAHINHMAGLGFSYQTTINQPKFKLYGQLIGEDEANYLPNCFMHLFGLEWSSTFNSFPLNIGVERIDTRIDKSTNGNCGKNTAYNNNIYPYTNNNKSMGAYIDSEGTSTELNSTLQVKKGLEIKYSLKDITINDTNWQGHRLSNKYENGLINSVTLNVQKDKFITKFNITHQDFNLKKVKIKKGLSASLSTSYTF